MFLQRGFNLNSASGKGEQLKLFRKFQPKESLHITDQIELRIPGKGLVIYEITQKRL